MFGFLVVIALMVVGAFWLWGGPLWDDLRKESPRREGTDGDS